MVIQHQPARRSLSISTVPVPRRLEASALSGRRRSRPLAEPPAGSGLRAIPGDPGLPLVGHGLEWMRYGPRFELAQVERHGPVSWMKAFGITMVMVGGADATQAVLANTEKAYSQTGWNLFFDPFFRRGLMMLDAAEHLQHRRIMQQAFTRPRLAGYADVAGQVARAELGGQRDQFLAYPTMQRLTMDIGSQVFMATSLGANERIRRAFTDAVEATVALVRFPLPGGKWRAGLRGRKTLEEYFWACLPAKRNSDGADLFSAMATAHDDGQRFTDTEIIDHMIFLLLAAFETTATAVTAAIYYLAKHPEWQERARAESVGLGRVVDLDGLDRLVTLELVINESLRLVAPLPDYVRRTLRDVDLVGYHLPADTITVVMPGANHYDPTYWRNPASFEPDRFADPRREDRGHRLAWLPFGSGAHKCIGMRLAYIKTKTILHELLLNHRWRLPQGHQMRWDWTSAPRPVDDLPIVLDRIG
jgi:cytochrome P450